MITQQNFLFYGIGLLAFFAIGYVLAIIQSKVWEEKNKQRSLNFQRGIVKGKISEQIAPYLPDFPKDLNASEARFIGNPIDFVVFRGANDKNISEVVFVEVKTGHPHLNGNESSLKDTIEQKRVRYVPYHVSAEVFNQK